MKSVFLEFFLWKIEVKPNFFGATKKNSQLEVHLTSNSTGEAGKLGIKEIFAKNMFFLTGDSMEEKQIKTQKENLLRAVKFSV